MLTFLTIAIVFAVVASAVTAYAIWTAKEGYEDELGFHLVSEENSSEGESASAPRATVRAKVLSRMVSVRF